MLSFLFVIFVSFVVPYIIRCHLLFLISFVVFRMSDVPLLAHPAPIHLIPLRPEPWLLVEPFPGKFSRVVGNLRLPAVLTDTRPVLRIGTERRTLVAVASVVTLLLWWGGALTSLLHFRSFRFPYTRNSPAHPPCCPARRLRRHPYPASPFA